MDQNHAHRALARRFFVLIHPASVVSQRLAFEKFRIIRRRLVHQHQQHFAVNIHAFVIVPVVFRSLNAIAHINNFRVHIGLRLLGLVESHIFIQRPQIHRRTLLRHQRKLRLRLRSDSHQRHLLQVGPVVAGRFQSIFGKLRCHIFCCNVTAALPRAAPFQQIVRKIFHVPADMLRINRLHGGGGRAWKFHRHSTFSCTLLRCQLRRSPDKLPPHNENNSTPARCSSPMNARLLRMYKV